ncbi:hypothetical protein JAAARDRAFT_429931 [Jaapia argillacea MUCL 33604]|uniref:Uncharacterized protein n=1 Tax=Jaapia argillacea MUCL 33604 TaxID=933084 RepID=A0A067PTC6_9AGAM|nr:hypothetical protein JAAARDRAFT_429931 [Jaapia argillacea MUCL 33604]
MISSGFTLLEHIYPSSLQKFLTHGQSAARLPPFCHFVAIRLADEYGHPIIRPMAMYCAALLRYKFLLEGDVDNEGNRHFLSADDAALVLAGRDEMRAMGRRFTYAYLIECALMNQGASPLCHNKPVLDSDSDIAKPDKPKSWTCQKWLKQLYVALDQNRFFEEKSIGIHLLSKKSWNTVTRNMCSDCVRELNKHVGFGVEDCWETIPQIFEQGLCWEQMRMKEENAQVPLK